MTGDEYDKALQDLGVNPNPMCPAVIGGRPAGYHKMGRRTVLIFVGSALSPDERQAQIDELKAAAKEDAAADQLEREREAAERGVDT